MTLQATLQWSRNVIAVADSAEGLSELLSEIESKAHDHPIMVDVIASDGRSLGLGLGRDKSVLSIAGPHGSLPYFVSVGDSSAEGRITFDYGGEETEFHMRNAVPIAYARMAVLQFLTEPGLPNAVYWEED